jgi:hypothetical protein
VYKRQSSTFVHLPTPLDRSLNQDSLGDRFFYGVDEQKFFLDSQYPHPSNFVVAGIQDEEKLTLSYFPLHSSGNQHFFSRGQSRLDSLDALFTHQFFTKNKVDKTFATVTTNSL